MHLAVTAALITFFLCHLYVIAEAELVAYIGFQFFKNASDSFVYVPRLLFASTLVSRLLVRRQTIFLPSRLCNM
jgi:hypothetical protein